MNIKESNFYRCKSLIFAFIGQILVITMGTNIFGVSPVIDGGTFYLCELAGMLFMIIAAIVEKFTTSRLLFLASAFAIFLGAFFAPAFRSFPPVAFISSGLTLLAMVHTAAVEYL